MENIYSKGSLWRRWEPHIHTPGTVKNDQFGGSGLDDKWERYINDINGYKNDIAVIAITDYLCTENYFRFKKAIKDGSLTKKFDLVLPNIELRISPVTGGSTPINIHCIFNPAFDEKLKDRFHSKLKFHYQTRDYLATRSELIELGRKYKNDTALDENVAYKEGIKIFIPPIDQLKKLLEEDSELRENCVVIVSNKSNDGVSGLNAHAELLEGVKHNILEGARQTIYYLCDGIFSSNEKDIDYFLGKGIDSVEEVKRKCKNLKPCLHGSDAHQNDKIFEPDNKKYCWIKADPTFEGFKQIVFEPFTRIRIQEDKPDIKRPHLIIDKVRFISNPIDKTFPDDFIEVNANLNSIIGGKSSGKSLLLYYVAKTIDRMQVLNKYGELPVSDQYPFETEIQDFDFEVLWGDGVSYKLSNSEDSKTRQITYIPQMYINHLAEKRGNDELKKLVQSILEEKPEFFSFYSTSKDEISRLKGLIASNVFQYFEQKKKLAEIQNQIKGKGDKDARKHNLQTRKDELALLRAEAGFTEEQEQDYLSQLSKRNIHRTRKQNFEILLEVVQKDFTIELRRIEEEVIKAFDKLQENNLTRFMGRENLSKGYTNTANKYRIELSRPFANIKKDIDKKIEQLNRCIERTKERIAIYNAALKPHLDKITKQEKLDDILTDIAQEETVLGQIRELEQQETVAEKQLKDYKDEIIKEYTQMMQKYQEIIQEVNTKYSDINPDKQINLKAILTFDANRFFNNCTRNVSKHASFASTFGSYFDYNDFVFVESSHLADMEDFFEKILTEDIKYNQGGSQNLVCDKMFDDYFVIDFEIFEKDESIFKMSPGKKGLILLLKFDT